MQGPDLVAALLLGVLLPASFSRPSILETGRMRPHIHRRLEFAYSYGSFAAMGFVYVGAVYLLRPVHALTPQASRVLGGAGLLLLAIACVHHLPPMFVGRGWSAWNAVRGAATALLGFICGGFLAADAVFDRASHARVASVSWAVLLVISAALMYGVSGLSPQSRLLAYRYRRGRKKRRVASRD